MLDLHMHSTYSDGSESIETLILDAKKKKLSLIAITDHDTYYDWSSRSTSDLTILSGMEISAYDYLISKKVHLLVYGNNLKFKHLKQHIELTLPRRHENSLKQLAYIQSKGYDINIETLKTSQEGILYKQHIMENLVQNGHTDTINGALYQSLFKQNNPVGDILYPDVLDVLHAAKKDQLMIILAHPGLSGVLGEVDRYVHAGLKGIETYHSLANPNEIAIAHEYALRNHLIETIGSDYHGKYGIEPPIGSSKLSDAKKRELYMKFLEAM